MSKVHSKPHMHLGCTSASYPVSALSMSLLAMRFRQSGTRKPNVCFGSKADTSRMSAMCGKLTLAFRRREPTGIRHNDKLHPPSPGLVLRTHTKAAPYVAGE